MWRGGIGRKSDGGCGEGVGLKEKRGGSLLGFRRVQERRGLR